jgi:hypothetical protein
LKKSQQRVASALRKNSSTNKLKRMPTIRKTIPVNPLLNSEGAFVSLNHYGERPIKPNPLSHADPGRSEYGKEYKLSYSLSSKLEIAAIGGIEANLGTVSFIHDSIVYRLSRHPVENGNDLIKGTWWGYGLRLKIVVKNVQLGVQVNWLGVAAAAQLGYLDAEFEIESIGITNSELFGLLPAPTDFNVVTYKDILAAGNKIRSFAHSADPGGVLYKPLRIEVELPDEQSFDPMADDRALIFVYQRVQERKPLKDAKKQASDLEIDPSLISKFYKDVFGLTREDERPSKSHRDEASEWLRR